jgi:hypothetical protein
MREMAPYRIQKFNGLDIYFVLLKVISLMQILKNAGENYSRA